MNFQLQSIELINGTDQFDRWKVTPQALDFKVYFFNVTNVAEIQAGGQPRVQEVGPFVYT